jgi:uncharacterized protein YkwD
MGYLKRIAFAAIISVVMGTALPSVTATAQTKSSCGWTVKSNERGFAADTNAARAKAGVGKLTLDPQLSKAARMHTREMIKRNLLYHTPNDKLTRRVTNWTVLGENVGVGGTVDSLQAAFLHSPEHKANIVFPQFKYMGIGSVERNDRLWVTVIFESAKNPGTPLRMPSC